MSELSVDPQHPWLGLASFTEDARAWFYGRDDEVTESQAHRLLAASELSRAS